LEIQQLEDRSLPSITAFNQAFTAHPTNPTTQEVTTLDVVSAAAAASTQPVAVVEVGAVLPN
jgi:hypothetical protein